MSGTFAVIQARTGSTRLPGKVLAEIAGKSILWHVLDRVRRAKRLDGVCIATTDQANDDPIRALASSWNIDCFSGSESDVLDRFVQAARRFSIDTIVRITSDCPLIDPELLDQLLLHFQSEDFDAVRTGPGHPDGLDVEIFARRALELAWEEALLPSEREHVGPYIWNHPERFRTGTVEPSDPEDRSWMRWTVDQAEDLAFVRQIYDALYRPEEFFGTADILLLLQSRPDLLSMNDGIIRNEGLLKSLERDKRFLSQKGETIR